ncbi:FAD-dependent monooxygenase [Acidobacteria bacterium AH-259-G07]|nr:FAD-dependent monooxygenase [Acidobacteria bacterium AH-259-G07]
MSFDAIIVGGGLGGSALAKNLAEAGHRVLVLERETRFKDRVRGEQMHPWGVAAARSLGVYDHIIGNQTRWWITYLGGSPMAKRDLARTTPHGVGSFNFYHPDMQESLLGLAEQTGAEVRRGITVDSVVPGSPPSVKFQKNGKREVISAQVVVGADGRNSMVRSWAGFQVQQDPDRLLIAGTLLEVTPVPDDSTHLVAGPEGAVLMAPLGEKRARVYYLYRKADGDQHLSGNQKVSEFLSNCRAAGAPGEWFDGTHIAGPLAQFNGADHWVDHPARDNVVLTGDAAAASDPDWGCGLSLTLLDVLHLRDCLCSTSDWSAALDHYARKHDRCYGTVHQITNWMAELIWTTGPAADERRARILARIFSDPAGLPDLIGLGPESPTDEPKDLSHES